MSESDTEDPQTFEEWLKHKEDEYTQKYRSGERTADNARQKDIALGRLRAYRDARQVFLGREEKFGDST